MSSVIIRLGIKYELYQEKHLNITNIFLNLYVYLKNYILKIYVYIECFTKFYIKK